MSDIKSMLQDISNGNLNSARDKFNSIVDTRLSDKIDQLRPGVVSAFYDSLEGENIDINTDDIEVDLEDSVEDDNADSDDTEESECTSCNLEEDLEITEAEYEGRKVKLNDPIRTSEDKNKKFKVYVKNDKGNIVVVRFGDPNMEIKRDDPKRRSNFRARHNCANPGPKWKARYWSCRMWAKGQTVSDLD